MSDRCQQSIYNDHQVCNTVSLSLDWLETDLACASRRHLVLLNPVAISESWMVYNKRSNLVRERCRRYSLADPLSSEN